MYPSHLNQREIIDIIITKFLDNQNDFVGKSCNGEGRARGGMKGRFHGFFPVKCGLQCIHAMLTKEAGVNGVNIRGERWFERMKMALMTQVRKERMDDTENILHSDQRGQTQ